MEAPSLRDGDAFEDTISKLRFAARDGACHSSKPLSSFFRVRRTAGISTSENIAITNGSQSALSSISSTFFPEQSPHRRTILFPLVPEYVGYADQGIERGTFVTLPATAWKLDRRALLQVPHRHTARDSAISPDIPEVGAICVSRPTNPTGNVLTGRRRYRTLADACRTQPRHPAHGRQRVRRSVSEHRFPRDRRTTSPAPYWDHHTILSMSLSKIGLPSIRTGIVIADAGGHIGALRAQFDRRSRFGFSRPGDRRGHCAFRRNLSACKWRRAAVLPCAFEVCAGLHSWVLERPRLSRAPQRGRDIPVALSP